MVSSNCWPSSKHVFPATGDILQSAILPLGIITSSLHHPAFSKSPLAHITSAHGSALLFTIRPLIILPPHHTIQPSANAYISTWGQHCCSPSAHLPLSAAHHLLTCHHPPSTICPLHHPPPSHLTSSAIHHPPACPLSTVCPLAIHCGLCRSHTHGLLYLLPFPFMAVSLATVGD